MKLFLFYIFVGSFFCSGAQSSQIVTGVLRDNDSPVEFANVLLTSKNDSNTVIKSALPDSSGRFTIPDITSGEYILKVQMIGYTPVRREFTINPPDVKTDLGNIQLTADSKILESVEITAHKNLVKKTPQGFIVNAKDNITQVGGTATDLLRNIPTVVVDADGNISIRGKSPLILVNGRNSSLGATDRIPASSIESIEIINNPSAQYDADAEGGIINIRLKKNSANGTNGSVALGAGYGAKGRVNSSFIINHQAGKWNLGLAYDNRFAGRTRKANASRTSYYLPDDYLLTQNRFDNRFEQTQNLKLNIDFNPDKKNSFGLEIISNLDGQDNDETLVSMFTKQNNDFNTKNSRESIEIGREKVAEAAFSYSRKFDDPRRNLSVNISSSFNYETENTDITTQSLYADNSFLGSALLQRTHNYQNSNVSNYKIDYAHPVSKKGVLETGYKAITRYTNADFKSLYYYHDSAYIENPRASNIFDFNEQVHAAYIQFRSVIGDAEHAKWKYDIGIRGEEVVNHGKTGTGVAINRQYFNYFPTANLVYNINPSDFFKLSFSRRINRPGLGQLNPFIDITDSLNQHGGNPYLKPELVNSLETGYSKEWKKVSFSASMFYRYSTNIIRPYLFLQNNGVVLTQPVNFGNATTYGFESIVSLFPFRFWSMNLSGSVFQQLIDGSNVNSDVSNNVLSWYGKMINNFTMWKGSKLQVLANYNSPVATPQGSRIAVYNVDLGFQQKMLRGKGGLGIVVTDIFNTQKSGVTAAASDFSYKRTFKVDTRAVLVTFAYSFGTAFKESLIENKFSND